MSYMRNEKGIQIEGSSQKKNLRYMGYFHGYKGYRYCHSPNSSFNYNNFRELQAVYNFDMNIKSILYSQIMFLETTIKNYTLEIILDKAKSNRFADIYSKLLNNYKSFPIGSPNYKSSITKKMNVRNKIYNNISRDYGKRSLVNHYYDKDQPVPIWSIFELLSLGEFGSFISCLNQDIKKDISKSIGINSAINSDGKMLELIIYSLKDLRNAVAHNNTVFDTRFKTSQVSTRISNYLSVAIGINNICFSTIVDYVILISFLMFILKCNKTEIYRFINNFERCCETLRKSVPINIYSRIIHTDARHKLSTLRKFL